MKRIKKGDEVMVITGRSKGQTGHVLSVLENDRLLVERRFQFFVYDSLVCRVHIHDDQAIGVFGEDVNSGQLGDRKSERWYFTVFG